MKWVKVFFLIVGPMMIAIAIVLLLNFTAPNPTGRRYSSQMPLTTGQGSTEEIGESGSNILAVDLGIPRNDDADQLQCFCSLTYNPGNKECNSCAVRIDTIKTHRRPDFLTARYVAESKNTQNYIYGRISNPDQIADYAASAKALGIPLFVYTRVNTLMSPEFYQLVASTGGRVVHYFTVPGWVDPVDEAARIALGIGSGMFLLGLLMPTRLPRLQSKPRQAKAKRPDDPISEAARSIDDMEDFVSRTQDKKRFEIDVEDSRDDET